MHRILFIDDEESLLRTLKTYFERLGHEVSTATTRKDGLGLYEQVEPHVTVLDLNLPGASGLDILRELRRKHATVIMLTGQGEIESAVEAMRLGAENFLQKPVDLSHLAATVEKAAEKADLRHANREMRARLTPNLKRTALRALSILLLVAAAVAIGMTVGSDRSERPARPIPIPLEPGDSAPGR